MVKHGALERTHVYRMLGSKDARVRRAAFTLLEASNPTLRRDSELFIEIMRRNKRKRLERKRASL